jgi:hypothetical protein
LSTPSFLRDAIKRRDDTAAPVSQDRLDAITNKATEARDLELEIADLEEVLSEKKVRLNAIYHAELPELMLAAGVDTLGLPAQGNQPAYDGKLKPFYSANIAASWDAEKRAEGFRALEEVGAADLIKQTVTVQLPRGSKEEAEKLVKTIGELGWTPAVAETVNHQTLTAWLKAQVETGGTIPPLDKIGGTIGNKVTLKKRKDA